MSSPADTFKKRIIPGILTKKPPTRTTIANPATRRGRAYARVTVFLAISFQFWKNLFPRVSASGGTGRIKRLPSPGSCDSIPSASRQPVWRISESRITFTPVFHDQNVQKGTYAGSADFGCHHRNAGGTGSLQPRSHQPWVRPACTAPPFRYAGSQPPQSGAR